MNIHLSSTQSSSIHSHTCQKRGMAFSKYTHKKYVYSGWFLDVPSWAEVRPKKKRSYMQPRKKTTLCESWLAARERRKPPEGAPPWWGCPRGRACDFAHGDQELRGKVRVHNAFFWQAKIVIAICIINC